MPNIRKMPQICKTVSFSSSNTFEQSSPVEVFTLIKMAFSHVPNDSKKKQTSK